MARHGVISTGVPTPESLVHQAGDYAAFKFQPLPLRHPRACFPEKVLTPQNEGAGLLLVQMKTRAMSCEKAADAVDGEHKALCPPAAISTGTSGEPIGMFWESVRW